MKCIKCGYELTYGSVFCENCGQKQPEMERTFCANCGAEIFPGSDFCGNCGWDVNSENFQNYVRNDQNSKKVKITSIIIIALLLLARIRFVR